MENKGGVPVNDVPDNPEEQEHAQQEKIVAQGQQGIQRILKICYLCHGGNKMQSLNWARHMKKFHADKKGIRFVDWCYDGEEPMMEHLKMRNDDNQEHKDDQQPEARPKVQHDKFKNTMCTQCKEYKRKRDFPELKDVKARGQKLSGLCSACINWMRKRENKAAEKEEAKENKEQQVNLPVEPLARVQPILNNEVVSQDPKDIAKLMDQLNKIIQQQNEKIQKLEENQLAIIAKQQSNDFISSVLLKPSESQYQKLDVTHEDAQLQFQNNIEGSHQDIWQQSLRQQEVNNDLLINQLEHFEKIGNSQQHTMFLAQDYVSNQEHIKEFPLQEISRGEKLEDKLEKQNVFEEQKKPEVDFTTGEINQSTITQFIEEQKDRFTQFGMNELNLTQLLNHPVTIVTKYRARIKGENYFLLHPTIQAFTDLVKQQASERVQGIRLFSLKEFQLMMKNFSLGIFKDISPDIEDQDKHIILPYYNDQHAHWCFIILDINLKGEEHKVYIVDSVTSFQKKHKKTISQQGNTWCNMVRRWIELQFDDPNKKCSFEVLDIKNQDNNFDCGLLLCLLIWQFFQTRDVQDLVKFPWAKEFSHHYRFALARAISLQDLAPIKQLVLAKQKVLASM